MAAPTRRERLRAATVNEIKQTARRLLVDDGPAAISLRAIAREMGMTAPALYRYVPSHEALLDVLCADLKNELTVELERARDSVPESRIGERLQATCRAFRGWAIQHPAEFSLIFASTSTRPHPGACQSSPADTDDSAVPAAGQHPAAQHGAAQHGAAQHEAAQRFGRVFLDLILELWRRRPFPVIEPGVFPPALRTQLERFVADAGLDVPIGVGYVFLSCWARLYGLVALEIFGHLDFALSDVEPLFEAEVSAMAAQLDLTLDR